MEARFKYEFLHGRVRYVVDEGKHVRLYEVWPDSTEPKLLDSHPAGVISHKAWRQSIKEGLRDSPQIGYDLIRLFENEDLPKRYVGGWLYEATVTYEGETFDITVHVFQRRVESIVRRVTKFATLHAIQRAKERYDLVLDAETAEGMINKLISGAAKPQPGGRDGMERAELVYDQEVFTVVWKPEEAKIITVTPTGGYRQSVDLLRD